MLGGNNNGGAAPAVTPATPRAPVQATAAFGTVALAVQGLFGDAPEATGVAGVMAGFVASAQRRQGTGKGAGKWRATKHRIREDCADFDMIMSISGMKVRTAGLCRACCAYVVQHGSRTWSHLTGARGDLSEYIVQVERACSVFSGLQTGWDIDQGFQYPFWRHPSLALPHSPLCAFRVSHRFCPSSMFLRDRLLSPLTRLR